MAYIEDGSENAPHRHYDSETTRTRRPQLDGMRPPRLLDPTLGSRYVGHVGDATAATIRTALNTTTLAPPVPINPLAPPNVTLIPPSSATYSFQSAITNALAERPLLDVGVTNLMRQAVESVSAQSHGFTRPAATVQSDGTVRVGVTTVIDQWNREAAKIMVPFTDAIMGIAVVPYATRRKLIERPLDAILDLMDPIETMLDRVVNRVMAKKGNRQNYFGSIVDLRTTQSGDSRFALSTRNYVKRLRVAYAFTVLFFTQPVELAVQMAVEGVDVMGTVFATIAGVADEVSKVVGTSVEKARQVAQDGVRAVSTTVSSILNNLLGYNGVGAVGADDAAVAGGATGATAAGGIGFERFIHMALKALADALIDALRGEVASTIRGEGLINIAFDSITDRADPKATPALLPPSSTAPGATVGPPSSTPPGAVGPSLTTPDQPTGRTSGSDGGLGTGGLGTGAKVGIGIGIGLAVYFALKKKS